MGWSKTVVQLKHHVRSRNGAKASREGYVNEEGVIAVPPKDARKIKAWLKKMGIHP